MSDLDPPCVRSSSRCKTIGRMSWPLNPEPGYAGPHASAYVCASEQHQRVTAGWVYSVTGHLGEFAPFKRGTS